MTPCSPDESGRAVPRGGVQYVGNAPLTGPDGYVAVYGEHCDADRADAERLARIVPLTHLPIDGIRNFFEALFGSESEPGCEEAKLGVMRRRSDPGECC